MALDLLDTSARLAWHRPENLLARLERERRSSGEPLLDLTESNPTRAELPYPSEALREALATAGAERYDPTPRGLPSARTAVAREYERRGVAVDPDALVLTASSSESYALLFKLLCDPGDAILVPEPSYPLFDYLARLEGVTPVPYRLEYRGGWELDGAALRDAVARAPGRARVLVVVSPNNPTGSYVKRHEAAALAALARDHGMAVVSDEVFADFAFGPDESRVSCLAADPVVTSAAPVFSLGGLSKSCGLPQMKLGWILVGGPPAIARTALERLELVADTYLSVSTPVQLALPRLLALGEGIRRAIQERTATNRDALERLTAGSPCTPLRAEAGWSTILRVPATRSDEEWAADLLVNDGVLVHPGYFFDLPQGAYLVPSLLPPAAAFQAGIERILARVSAP